MILRSRPVTLFVAVSSLLTVAALGQGQGPGTSTKVAAGPRTGAANTVTAGGYLYVIDRCDLASLREGVLASLERQVGHEVEPGQHIASLNSDVARLTTKKAEVAAKNTGEVAKAKAQQDVAMTVYARSLRLSKEGAGYISRDQLDKEKAEVQLYTAMVQVANEAIEVNKAECEIARQIEAEHEITTPIGGIITEVLRRPGERVGANEPVVKIVNLDRLR